ncbi:MAG: NAD(P)H-dependent oxidoreductase subunit E [Gammaproteobacteria bacterium]|nr:MAG: NAD(P)H-dependent oxidoreductase subunit E [Gammaproteobacteria bacterium]
MSEQATARKSLTELLPAAAIKAIDVFVAKYPSDRKRSAVMSSLMIAQENNAGFLSEELMDAVADYLEIPHMAAYEVATFYTMYNLKPVGEHVINVCTNISCMLRGSKEIVEQLNKKLNIKFGETTTDNKFTLKEVECQGACAGAPMCEIDKVFHENLTPESINEIVDNILAKSTASADKAEG